MLSPQFVNGNVLRKQIGGLNSSGAIPKKLKAVGIKDVYSKCSGKLKTTFNAAKACMAALEKIGEVQL